MNESFSSKYSHFTRKTQYLFLFEYFADLLKNFLHNLAILTPQLCQRSSESAINLYKRKWNLLLPSYQQLPSSFVPKLFKTVIKNMVFEWFWSWYSFLLPNSVGDLMEIVLNISVSGDSDAKKALWSGLFVESFHHFLGIFC